MLTPPKWQLVWLKSQHSLRNSSKKIMFPKPSDKILDDLSKCCSSLSKELSLEALSCWRIWLEYQEFEDWKQNDICYSAIRPLVTKKFHPLAKDSDVIVNKLNLMWFALQKVQSFMHLEGPQHILEVFVQSCVNWLSCSEEIDTDVIHLILKLLCSLFSRNDEISFKNLSFPLLKNNLLLPNKFFGRLLNSFLEIFHNWMKIKEKTELLYIWKHFLEHCEKSFKFIPVTVWHKIFRLVKNICGDENESFFNKMTLLHMCAISLKSVMYNSKFIDSSNLLTTPAEALLKIAVDLCLNAREENYCFEIFNYCKEICQVLSKSITCTFGYDFCLYLLPKIEEIDCKTFFWGLWCGLAELFKEEIKKLNLDEYSKIEIKIFRKLRAIAVNFELDKFDLDYRSILMIQKQLGFFRIGSICEDCPTCCSKLKILMESQGKDMGNIDKDNLSGMIGCDTKNTRSEGMILEGGYFQYRDKTKNSFKKVKNFSGLMKTPKTTFFQILKDKGWIKNCLSLKKFDSRIYTTGISLNGRLINNYANRRSILFAPMHLQRILDDIITKTHKNNDKSSQIFVENVKKLERKTKEGQIFAPIRFLVSLKGRKGVEFCGVARRFWELLDEVVHDIDFEANLNVAMSKKENSIFCFCMFLLLVNFTKNLFVGSLEEVMNEESGTGEEMTLSMKIVNFMKSVVYCEEKHSRADFIDDISEVLPRSNENPLVLLMKLNSVNKSNENGRKYVFEGFSNQESTLNDNLIIFKYFDEFENKVCSLEKNLKNCKARKRNRENRNRQKSDSDISCLGDHAQILGNNNPKVKVIPVNLYESWNCMTLSALETTVNKAQEPEDLEASSAVFGSNLNENLGTAKDFEKGLEDASSNNKTSEESDIENRRVSPPKRKLRSFKKRGKKRALTCEKKENLTEDERKEKTEEEIDSPRVSYSLRSRPLKFPNKFKDMDVKVFKEKGVKRKSSLKRRTEKRIENAEGDEVTVEPENWRSSIKTNESDEAENVITDVIDPEIVNIVHSMILALEREEENEMEDAKSVIKLEIKTEEEGKDSENVSRHTMRTRGIKRRIQCEDEKKNVKQLKIEEYAENVKEEPMSCEDESRKCHVPMVQNRGSRMLALIPESPKIERFHNSSPSTKYQTVKFPWVQRNSRASKMLALLPEKQEPDSNGDVNCLDESSGGKDENLVCGIGGSNPGKIHHITPKKNILFETPKHSLRQRKSIRFDDDRNEYVTYFTDSPPLLIIRSPKFMKH